VADAEIGQLGRVVAADCDVAGDAGHEVVDAVVPAHIEHRHNVAEAEDLSARPPDMEKAWPAQPQVAA